MRQIIQFLILFLALQSTSVWANNQQQTALLEMYSTIKNKQVDLLQDQPLSIKSKVVDKRLSAEVYAIKKYAFSDLVAKLSKPDQWCHFITLHLNIKACLYQLKPDVSLSFFAGRKFYEPVDAAYELRYRFIAEESSDNFFSLLLTADEGPFGTSDYVISLQILKINEEVLLHMSLSYQTSFSSRLGTSVYLSTIGADKVGFSQKLNEDGESEFVRGIEGIIERNVMRYYLALSTYLDSQDLAKMPEQWFLAAEKYHQQLHEVTLQEYLDAKKLEYEQQTRLQKKQ